MFCTFHVVKFYRYAFTGSSHLDLCWRHDRCSLTSSLMITTSTAICIKGQLITGQWSVVKTATGQHDGQKCKEQKEVLSSSLQACIDCTDTSRVAVCGFLELYSAVISQFPWLNCRMFLIRDVSCANTCADF